MTRPRFNVLPYPGAARDTATPPEAPARPAPLIEPSLTLDDVCAARNVARRTGERERSAGLWPKPDFIVGTGKRKSPRWRPETIRRWLAGGGRS